MCVFLRFGFVMVSVVIDADNAEYLVSVEEKVSCCFERHAGCDDIVKDDDSSFRYLSQKMEFGIESVFSYALDGTLVEWYVFLFRYSPAHELRQMEAFKVPASRSRHDAPAVNVDDKSVDEAACAFFHDTCVFLALLDGVEVNTFS